MDSLKIIQKLLRLQVLKKPELDYREMVWKKSNLEGQVHPIVLELGYIMVDPFYRNEKLGTRLCEAICKRFSKEKIFATTRVNNFPMRSIFSKLQFVAFGECYENRLGTNNLQVFIKLETEETNNPLFIQNEFEIILN